MNFMIRRHYFEAIEEGFRSHPVVALLGPRQCGKTTLARQYAPKESHYFDLEDPTHLARLESAMLALEDLRGLVVIDEIQRRPDLFPVLRVLADRAGPRWRSVRFLILGSASRDLIRQGSESLAGRITFVEISPFSLAEVRKPRRLWLRGGFPRSYLSETLNQSISWRNAFIQSYVERDIPALGIQIPSAALRRFWLMLAHYNAQILNSSEIGRSLGIADTTVRRYLDILSGTFMVRQLQPWAENISKRQVRSPKIYFRDTGIFHALLGIRGTRDLMTHPKLGASWESFAMESVLSILRVPAEEAYFWATHGQAELDLLILPGGQRGPGRLGFEFKYTDHPSITKSMRIAFEDLGLTRLFVIYPGKERFPLDKAIEAVGLQVAAGLTLLKLA